MIAASAQPDPQLTFVGFGPVELAYPTFADEVDAVYWRSIMNSLILKQNKK